MDNTEAVVREFLAGVVTEALGDGAKISSDFAQKRFVKGDPAILAIQAGGVRELHVCFSGEAVTNFVMADEAKLARLRAGAIEQIRDQHKTYKPDDLASKYPFLIQIDYIKV